MEAVFSAETELYIFVAEDQYLRVVGGFSVELFVVDEALLYRCGLFVGVFINYTNAKKLLTHLNQ